jgi:predicted transcriptional regulator
MTVELSRTNQKRLQQYAASVGKTASTVANEALKYWWKTEGEMVLEGVEELKAKAGK